MMLSSFQLSAHTQSEYRILCFRVAVPVCLMIIQFINRIKATVDIVGIHHLAIATYINGARDKLIRLPVES